MHVATLVHHVQNVVQIVTHKQMVGPNARRIITMVADKQPFRDVTFREYPRYAMRALLMAPKVRDSILVSV